MTSQMLGFVAHYKDGEFCALVHGETRGKAKARFHQEFGFDTWDCWENIRLRRLPGLDDKPITYQNAFDAGFVYEDNEDGDIGPDEFVNTCNCSICKKG